MSFKSSSPTRETIDLSAMGLGSMASKPPLRMPSSSSEDEGPSKIEISKARKEVTTDLVVATSFRGEETKNDDKIEISSATLKDIVLSDEAIHSVSRKRKRQLTRLKAIGSCPIQKLSVDSLRAFGSRCAVPKVRRGSKVDLVERLVDARLKYDTLIAEGVPGTGSSGDGTLKITLEGRNGLSKDAKEAKKKRDSMAAQRKESLALFGQTQEARTHAIQGPLETSLALFGRTQKAWTQAIQLSCCM